MSHSAAANSLSLVTSSEPATRRRNLVFARVGRQSLHRNWLAEPKGERNWDLQLSTYDSTLADLTDGDRPLSVDTGTKWDSICRYFKANPSLLDEYDYVMFPDDDLLFDSGAISTLFKVSAEADLDIAQPALLPSSYISYPILVHCPQFRLRYTNYVEPMSPIIRTSYMKTLLPLLERWPTGWGQDDIWTMLMPSPAYRAAVIDAAPILHTRPLYTGDIYATFRKLGLDPRAELQQVRESFVNLPNAKLVYGGILKSGRRIGRQRTNAINGVHLLRVSSSVRKQSDARRVGLGMLARIVTKVGYTPVQLQMTAIAAQLAGL